MGTTVSPSILKRLTFAKYLLTRGALEHSKRDELSMAVAVLHFHDCVELFLDCVVEVVGADTRGVNLETIPSRIAQAAGKPMARAKVVKTVNALRVPLKHEGVLPNPTAVGPLLGEVEAFLEENAREFLAVEFADISVADMVDDQEVRGHLKEAEVAFAAEDYGRTLRDAAFAFRELTALQSRKGDVPGRWEQPLETELMREHELPDLSGWEAQQKFRHLAQAVNTRYRALAETVRDQRHLLRLGIDYSEYERFKRLTPTQSSRKQTGEWADLYVLPSSVVCRRENARFCLDFAITAVLRIEALHPMPGPGSRYTVEVTKDTVSVYVAGDPPGSKPLEERQACRGERFPEARLGVSRLRDNQHFCWFLPPDAMGRDRMLPLDAVNIVDD